MMDKNRNDRKVNPIGEYYAEWTITPIDLTHKQYTTNKGYTRPDDIITINHSTYNNQRRDRHNNNNKSIDLFYF